MSRASNAAELDQEAILRRLRCLQLVIAIATMACNPPMAIAVFEDKEFCIMVEQLAVAAEGDVGIWIDRMTRSAGIAATCPTKTVEFRRFTYAPVAEMNVDWKRRMIAQWNTNRCSSYLWKEAILNGWRITLAIWSADGGHAFFIADCKHE